MRGAANIIPLTLYCLRTLPASLGRWKVRSSPSERQLLGRSIRQAIQDSMIPVLRPGFSRARVSASRDQTAVCWRKASALGRCGYSRRADTGCFRVDASSNLTILNRSCLF